MPDESTRIIMRRFTGRILESGLLILAVALGVGTSAAGIALWADTKTYATEILSSPEYHEIIVGTHSDSQDMEYPVVEKPVRETAVLTGGDLAVADMIPTISHAYVSNRTMLHFINETSMARETEMRNNLPVPPDIAAGEPPPGGAEQPPDDREQVPGGTPPEIPGPEELARAKAQGDILIVDLEEAMGYSVSADFFAAWDMKTTGGSLFSENDFTTDSSAVVLGSVLAELMTPEGEEPGQLLGKKILIRRGYATVVGILEATGETYDESFFSPYSDGLTTGFEGLRRSSMNTQLRFTVDNPKDLDQTAYLLSDWFTRQFGEGQIMVSNPRLEAEKLMDRNTGISLLILFLSCAGLFIAAVNVSNILMSRSLRMKKHLGILMALGASRTRIVRLFAGEAVGITLAGSVLGTFLAFPLSRSMQEALGMGKGSFLFILLGVLIAFLLNLLFSLFPVRRYSRIDPAVAMRSA